MCEILVRVIDKTNADFYLNTQCHKRGDVIAAHEDGCVWGTEDLANPAWRILRIPGISVSQVLWVLVPEHDTDFAHPSKTLQRRAFKLDLDHPAIAAAGLRTFFDDHTAIAVNTPHPQREKVRSAIETLNSAGEVIDVQHPLREVVRHAVPDLSPAMRAQLGAIPFVGQSLRVHCIAEVTADLLETLKTKKSPIPDPAIIGSTSTVIG